MTDTTEYVSVPKVATEAMLDVAWKALLMNARGINRYVIAKMYSAMLAAAPTPPSLWKDIESAPKDRYTLAIIRGGTFSIPLGAGSDHGWVSFSGAVEAMRGPDGIWKDTRLAPCHYRPTHYLLIEDLLSLPTPPNEVKG